jgi:hypothetical protein
MSCFDQPRNIRRAVSVVHAHGQASFWSSLLAGKNALLATLLPGLHQLLLVHRRAAHRQGTPHVGLVPGCRRREQAREPAMRTDPRLQLWRPPAGLSLAPALNRIGNLPRTASSRSSAADRGAGLDRDRSSRLNLLQLELRRSHGAVPHCLPHAPQPYSWRPAAWPAR